MWTAIVIVGLVLAMMVGPIMLMQPTKRQRMLARLRTVASSQGLKVRMLRMPDGALRAGEAVALYYRGWPDSKPLKAPWLLARQPFAHGLHFLEDWDWSDQRRAPEAWHPVLRRALPELPRSVVAVEASSHTLGVAWLEQANDKSPEQATQELAQWLQRVMTQVASLRTAPSQAATDADQPRSD